MAAASNRPEKSEKPKKVIKMNRKRSPEKSVPTRVSMSARNYNPDDLIFAMDIGTRTVVGMIGAQEKDRLRVLSVEIAEHRNRAMYDGQIHDIGQVAEVVKEVKEKLEKKTGLSLSKVAVAAAGRTLKTCEVKVEREIEQGREIGREMVNSLEIEAIQKAQILLEEELTKEEKTQFYCVGCSVINYFLNGYVISNLQGHKGKKAGVTVLATFLPHTVVDSLYTVMDKVGLEVTSLTLEPIAAINVAIPRDLRLLNLALVDIGAGTSDIAVTRDGTVVAYAMSPIAGDEITERIAQHYLVDFNTGERIKAALTSEAGTVSFTDILGKKQVINRMEVLGVARPAIQLLAEAISQKILELNRKSPNAVFLVGGGSQVPELTGMISGLLNLPDDRVVVRGKSIVRNVRCSGRKLSGPEAITPLGIAYTAFMQRSGGFLTVNVNGKTIRLLDSKKLTVADALIIVGYNAKQLIGRTGKSLSFFVDGEKRTIRGEYGKPAEIYVNGMLSSIDTVINPGDDIRVIPAEDGKEAEATIRDIADMTGKLLSDTRVFVNGEEKSSDYRIEESDIIEFRNKSENSDTVAEPEPAANVAGITGQDAIKTLPAENSIFKVVVNGNEISLGEAKSSYIFVDVFNFINFDISRPQGNIVLRLNGRPAAFTDVIKPGDVIDIYWEK